MKPKKSDRITVAQREEELGHEVNVAEFLLGSKFPNIEKMKKQELLHEVEMWRAMWSWIPSNVKYYIARTGQQIGLTMRNYKRYLGILLDTYWTLDEVEIGVYDKVYDQVTGQNYFERKIVKTRLGGIIDLQWIKTRTPEGEMLTEEQKREIAAQEDEKNYLGINEPAEEEPTNP